MKIMKERKGFTLIELISVILIIAIVGAVAISRGISSVDAKQKSAAEALKGHIRYVQMKALNSDAPNCSTSHGLIMSGGSYSMFSTTGTGCTRTDEALPGASSSSGVSLPSGVTFTATTRVSFDRWGRPHTVGATASSTDGTGNSETITINLSHSGLPDETITITKNTGFVP